MPSKSFEDVLAGKMSVPIGGTLFHFDWISTCEVRSSGAFWGPHNGFHLELRSDQNANFLSRFHPGFTARFYPPVVCLE
jgi:hypothetical protein